MSEGGTHFPPRVLLAAIVAAGIAATAAPAADPILPAQYAAEASALAPKCGGLRAELIARMHYGEEIHVGYVALVTLHPAQGKTFGDVRWHRWWVDTYAKTIQMLKQGCAP